MSSTPCSSIRFQQARRTLGGLAVRATVAATLGVLATTAPAEASYELVARWASDSPEALDVDGRGSVYVASTAANNNHVTQYTTAGRVVRTWGSHGRGPGQFDHISGLAVDGAGRVLVADIDARIQTFDALGAFIGQAPVVGATGDRVNAYDVDVDARGESYLTHNGAAFDVPSGVLRFSASGQGLAAWGSEGAGDGQFDAPLGIASDGRGNVYVADAGNHRIQRFTDAGAYVGRWGTIGLQPGQLARPSGVATDSQGNVYVADTDNGRIQKYDPSGRLLDGFEVPATAGGSSPVSGSSRPRDVAVDAKGDVYTLDDHPGRFGSVYVYRPAATALTSTRLRYRSGRIAVTVSCRASRACRGTLRIAKGTTTIGTRSYRIKAGARATVRLKPTRRGRATLMRSRTHRLTVQLRQSTGKTVTGTLPLRR
jgi:sugar lactone lactonase YvrE